VTRPSRFRVTELASLKTGARTTALAALASAALSFASCDTERQQLMRDQFPTYPETVKRAIEHGYLLHGMTHEQVYLTLGPAICKTDGQYEGRPVEVWLYPPGGREPCRTAQHRVYFDNGLVSSWESRAR
jgi:hypothetical protein